MYRTIDASFWTDPDIRALSGPERYLFLYFVTNPHAHVSGIYYLPQVMIEHETGLKGKALQRGIDTLSKGYLAWYDPKNEVVFVRSMFRYQGRGQKHDRAAAIQLGNLHKSPLVNKFLEFYPIIRERVTKGYRYPIEGVSGVGTPEQEQEQDIGTGEEPPQPPLGASPFASGSAQVESGSQREDVPANDGPEGPAHGVREASTGEAAHEGFEAFWREYPRKIGKQAALKAWKRNRPGKQLTARIVEAIQAQVEANHFRGNDGQVDYIPNPATWLNQGRWEDEIVRPKTVEEEARELEERMAKAGGSA